MDKNIEYQYIEKARDEYNKAKNCTQQNELIEANQHYDNAKNYFLKTRYFQKYAIKCIFEISKNEIDMEKDAGLIRDINPTNEHLSYQTIIVNLLEEVNNRKIEIFSENNININICKRVKILFKWDNENFLTRLSAINYMISLYKEMEYLLSEMGLIEEAKIVYIDYMKNKIDEVTYSEKIPGDPWWKKLGYFFQEMTLRFFGTVSQFGVNLNRIVISTLLSTVSFWVLFWAFKAVKYKDSIDSHPANFLECFYFSIVTLFNVGSEIFIPTEGFGRVFECLESVLGWVLLGMLIAYITKKVR